jgi:hypothetical protein
MVHEAMELQRLGTLRKIPDDKKMCPKSLAAGNDEAPEFYICSEEKCGWWVKLAGSCAIQVVGREAWQMYYRRMMK